MFSHTSAGDYSFISPLASVDAVEKAGVNLIVTSLWVACLFYCLVLKSPIYSYCIKILKCYVWVCFSNFFYLVWNSL